MTEIKSAIRFCFFRYIQNSIIRELLSCSLNEKLNCVWMLQNNGNTRCGVGIPSNFKRCESEINKMCTSKNSVIIIISPGVLLELIKFQISAVIFRNNFYCGSL